MKKKIIILVVCIAVIGIALGGKYLYDFKKYESIMNALTISNIDISKIEDGTYQGKFDAKLVAAETKVTIKDGKITHIQLIKHENERGEDAEPIIERVLSAQSLDVDAVSGATNSSNVILKSIENALKKPNH